MFERLHAGYYLLLVLALIEFSLAFILGQAELDHYLSLGGFKTMLLPMGLVFPLVRLGFITVKITYRQIDRPTVTLWRLIRYDRRWLLRGTLFVFVILLLARSFASYKASIPKLNPYWADPMLVNLDKAVFGIDPWQITHSLFGPDATMLMDRAYALWFLMMMICMGWLAYTRNPKLQIRGLLSYLLTWLLLGNLTATWLSSVGPCFYEQFYGNPRFAPLMEQLRAIDADHHRLMALGAMNYLSSNVGADLPANGISAMPSLHVAIAMLLFLSCRSYAPSRLLSILAAGYAIVILIASVHLGWHYVSDGVVSIAVVSAIWFVTGKYVDWLERRERDRAPIMPATALPATS